MNLADLSAEFPRDAVHWRVQGKPYERNGTFSAMALAYIDARDVMDRLDEACGPENWQDEYVETVRGRIICRIGIRINESWVWKSDGAGGTQVESEKGGISDALKRAAVCWGVGRYLYRMSSVWVACEVKGGGASASWKKWAEDPWSKVKVQPEQKPVSSGPQTQFDATAFVKQSVERIEGCKSLSELQQVWGEVNGNRSNLLKNQIADLEAVKDKRKAELSGDDKAKQAPVIDDEIPY